MALAIVTHDREVAARARRRITMRDGLIVDRDADRAGGRGDDAGRRRGGSRSTRCGPAGCAAALTMLGVIIGVAAVVVLVAIGTGAKQKVEPQVEGLGSNLLLVVPGRSNFGAAPTVSRLRLEDVDAVARIVGDRDRVAATMPRARRYGPARRARSPRSSGVLDTTPKVFVRPLARGSYLSRSDVDTGRRVAVLGSAVADELFGERDPIGAQITIAGVRFRVVGVFAPLGQSLGVDRDNEVHIPITTAQRLFDTDRVDGDGGQGPGPGRASTSWARGSSPSCTSGIRRPSSARSPRSRSSACSATSWAC